MGLKIPNMFSKGYRTIPHETPTGQTAMFKPGDEMPSGQMAGVIGRGLGGRSGASLPPFKASRHAGAGDARAQVTGLARKEELAMKRRKADAEQAIGQTGRVLAADRAGQMTNREFAFQMRNLMRRRKRI